VRRGIPCGVKLPGPKTQIDIGSISGGADRNPEAMGEYVRLFQRFQQLRPKDGPEEIATLIELVEKGILKEEGEVFVVRGADNGEADQLGMSNDFNP
jgi:hypothetical protein